MIAGYRIDALVAQQLKEATGSEFLFLQSGGPPVASTLNSEATNVVVRNLAAAQPDELVSDGISRYARFETPLPGIAGQKVGDLYILRCFDGSQRAHRQPLLANRRLVDVCGVRRAGPDVPSGAPHCAAR